MMRGAVFPDDDSRAFVRGGCSREVLRVAGCIAFVESGETELFFCCTGGFAIALEMGTWTRILEISGVAFFFRVFL